MILFNNPENLTKLSKMAKIRKNEANLSPYIIFIEKQLFRKVCHKVRMLDNLMDLMSRSCRDIR